MKGCCCTQVDFMRDRRKSIIHGSKTLWKVVIYLSSIILKDPEHDQNTTSIVLCFLFGVFHDIGLFLLATGFKKYAVWNIKYDTVTFYPLYYLSNTMVTNNCIITHLNEEKFWTNFTHIYTLICKHFINDYWWTKDECYTPALKSLYFKAGVLKRAVSLQASAEWGDCVQRAGQTTQHRNHIVHVHTVTTKRTLLPLTFSSLFDRSVFS